jgi:single-stranded-DNA-specific exonuclease
MNMNTSNNIFTLRDGSSVQPLILRMLNKRGIKTKEQVENFLEPQLKDLPSPTLMQDLEKAATIVGNCIIQKEPILIWGDYDVDGTTATALLLLFFKAIGHEKVEYYIPNRLHEGYGLQVESLKRISAGKVKKGHILITVDNGISAHNAVDTAKKLGYEVVITDHHTPPETSVDADAILNPRQESCQFPGKNLAGVGVAFYLAIGIRSYLQKNKYFKSNQAEPNLKQFLDLVSIGTVADMVELDNTNRILVRAGLESIAESHNPGISALCLKTNLDCTLLRSEDIAFQLAPKINAAGRLGFADKAVSLLTCQSISEAERLSSTLISNNEERKHITLFNLDNAIHYIEKEKKEQNLSVLVAGDFHIGVAGIVASNLVEKFNKPSVVLCAQTGGIYKGSARSTECVNLYTALAECREVLLGFGGHAMAAGMSLKIKDLPKFQKLLDNAIRKQSSNGASESVEDFKEEVCINELFQTSILKQLLLLEPHGTGNPQPVFQDPSVTFKDIRRIGKDKTHLRLSITNGSSVISGIGFGLGELLEKCNNKTDRSMLYSPSLNFFRGKRSWQARVIDILFTDT